jgi:Lipocalin-like domain
MPFQRTKSQGAHETVTAGQGLIGAWQLVSIELIGPGGRMSDPFYNEGATGMLIYDSSGWMSVQIANRQRPAMTAPDSRPVKALSAEQAQLEAAVLDSYYAYGGTWDYDAARDTVTHHVKTALIPAEVGMSYSQAVRLHGDQLIFTSTRHGPNGITSQTKVWKRLLK